MACCHENGATGSHLLHSSQTAREEGGSKVGNRHCLSLQQADLGKGVRMFPVKHVKPPTVLSSLLHYTGLKRVTPSSCFFTHIPAVKKILL